jgi:hypothetical protein
MGLGESLAATRRYSQVRTSAHVQLEVLSLSGFTRQLFASLLFDLATPGLASWVEL